MKKDPIHLATATAVGHITELVHCDTKILSPWYEPGEDFTRILSATPMEIGYPAHQLNISGDPTFWSSP